MEAPVEIRYSGVVLGRINELPSPGEEAPFFLPMREPMPVGTVLRLRLDDRETPVRVMHAIESADPNACGMQVRVVGESEIVAFEFIPAPVPMLENPVLETATPMVEIDAKKSAPAEEAVAAPAAEAPVEVAAESAAPALAEQGAAEPNVAAAGEGVAVESVAAEAVAADSQAAVAAEVPPSASAEAQAVPEAVPVAVGSSMTGALENATESVATESAAVATEAAGDSSAASGAAENLPPARPIAGGSARRKTKRRK